MKFLIIATLIMLIYADDWDRYLKLDPNYEVWWSMDDDYVTFQVEVATRGWVGFGVSPNGGMAGGDMVIGWINGNDVQFNDRYAEGKALPRVDQQQDWELLWHQKNDTHTKFRFKRLLDTCDQSDLLITEETTRIIYAYHSENPNSLDSVMYHGPSRRGTKSLFLKEEKVHKYSEKQEDLHYWEVRSPNVVISEETDTEYLCTFFKQPKLNRKHHIIQYDPIIQRGNEKFVHHMILYECTGITDEMVSKYNDKNYHECYTKDKIPKFPLCLTVNLGWAYGGDTFYFPENAGFPLGISDTEWFLLEVHYDNPGFKRFVDNSGMRLVYTPKLRQYDGAVLGMGNLWYPCIFVPPKQKEFIVSGHVAPTCLNQRVPPEGIKVFAALVHSHLIGKRMLIRHFRDDEELQPLVSDRNYDFNLQHYRRLSKIRTVLPNDHLIIECTYDSSKRTTVTFGGLPTTSEMCMGFLMYYPRMSLAITASCPYPRNFLISLGVTEIFEEEKFLKSPITGKNESYFDFLNNYPWSDNSIDIASHAMMFSPQINLCTDRGWKLVPTFVLSKYPNVKKHYRERSKCSWNRTTLRFSRKKPSKVAFSSENIGTILKEFEDTEMGERLSLNGTIIPYSLLDKFFL